MRTLRFTQVNTHVFRWILGLVVLSVLMMSGVFTTVHAQRPDTPNLSSVLKQSNKPALLEFYAEWCSSCRRMHPVVEKIHRDAHGKLDWIRVDVDDPKYQALVRQYHIAGTPTFIMYDKAGHPTFRMERMISGSLLRLLAARAVGSLPQRPVPASFIRATSAPRVARASIKSGSKDPFTLVRFKNDQCVSTSCKQDEAHYNALKSHVSHKVGGNVKWVTLSPNNASHYAYLKSIMIARKPYEPTLGRYYVLLSRDNVPLMRINHGMSPKQQHSMLSLLHMMLNGERP